MHNFQKYAEEAKRYWGYKAGDGLDVTSQVHFQAYVARQVPTQQDNEFCEAEMSQWEETLFSDPQIVVAVRESLLTSMTICRCTVGERVSLMDRYLLGQFTSVSKHYLVVGRAFAYSPVPITSKGVRGKFDSFPGLLDEVDYPSIYSSLGRKNISRLQLSNFTFTGNSETSILGLRAKLPGDRFVKIREGPRTILRGYKDIVVPDNFGVELAEEFGGVMYILYPYCLPGFTHDNLEFRSHNWVSPSDYVEEDWADGTMVLTKTEEYRTKIVPTEEVMADGGIWEVAYGVRSGLGTLGFLPIRPRPGKTPVSREQATRVLTSVVQSKEIMARIPQETRPIRINSIGPSTVGILVTEKEVVIDPMWRPADVPVGAVRLAPRRKVVSDDVMPNLVSVDDPAVLSSQIKPSLPVSPQKAPPQLINDQKVQFTPLSSSGNRTVIDSPPSVVQPFESSSSRSVGEVKPILKPSPKPPVLEASYNGSKLVIIRKSDMALFLIREGTKPLGFPGGTLENETYQECLVREVREEIKVDLTKLDYREVGYSYSVTDDGKRDSCASVWCMDFAALPEFCHSDLIPLSRTDQLRIAQHGTFDIPIRSYVGRILRSLMRHFRSVEDFYTYAVGGGRICNMTDDDTRGVTFWSAPKAERGSGVGTHLAEFTYIKSQYEDVHNLPKYSDREKVLRSTKMSHVVIFFHILDIIVQKTGKRDATMRAADLYASLRRVNLEGIPAGRWVTEIVGFGWLQRVAQGKDHFIGPVKGYDFSL